MQWHLIIFDLDGVLVDSRLNMQRAWDAVRQELAVSVDFEEYFARIGRPFAAILEELGLEDRASEIEAVYRRVSLREHDCIEPYADVRETLKVLDARGVTLAVVTSKDAQRTSHVLELFPPVFASVVSPGPHLRGKPEPDQLLAAMTACSADPLRTVYIGDMAVDCWSANRAGIAYRHATWGYGSTPTGAITLETITALVEGIE